MTGLALDTPSGEHIIRWVREDAIGVGARELRRSFAVSAVRLVEDWAVTDVASLREADLDLLLESGCDVILIGTGECQQQLAPALMYRALARGIGIEVMNNAAAARTYNLLLSEERNVLAAFILPAAAV